MSLIIKPILPHFGAEISGIDITEPLDQGERCAIELMSDEITAKNTEKEIAQRRAAEAKRAAAPPHSLRRFGSPRPAAIRNRRLTG